MTSRRNLLMALLFLSAAGISAPLYARDDDDDWDDRDDDDWDDDDRDDDDDWDDDDDDDDDDRRRRPRRRKNRDQLIGINKKPRIARSEAF